MSNKIPVEYVRGELLTSRLLMIMFGALASLFFLLIMDLSNRPHGLMRTIQVISLAVLFCSAFIVALLAMMASRQSAVAKTKFFRQNGPESWKELLWGREERNLRSATIVSSSVVSMIQGRVWHRAVILNDGGKEILLFPNGNRHFSEGEQVQVISIYMWLFCLWIPLGNRILQDQEGGVT